MFACYIIVYYVWYLGYRYVSPRWLKRRSGRWKTNVQGRQEQKSSAVAEKRRYASVRLLARPTLRCRMAYILPLWFIYFYFVSIDERPAMGSQPNLASRSEVVSIYKCPSNLGVLFSKLWGNVASTNKNASVNLQCVPWFLTQKRLRSVRLLWPTLWRPLHCNHQSCDMSSLLSCFLTPNLRGHWTELNQTWTHIHTWLLFEKFCPNSPGHLPPWAGAKTLFGTNFKLWSNISLQKNIILTIR